jgi:hypothetical protein
MADKKISALTASTTPLAGTEVLPIVQSGATVKVAVSDLTAGRSVSMSELTVTSTSLNIATITGGTSSNQGASTYYKAGATLVAAFGDTSSIMGGTPATSATIFTGSAMPLNIAVSGGNKWQFTAAGNLSALQSGNGIDFSATPGTGTSELFADYEEGTWTPSLTASTSGTITASGIGRYTKIGRTVTLTGYINVSAISSPVGDLVLNGFPFTVGAESAAGGLQPYGWANNVTTAGMYIGVNASNTTALVRGFLLGAQVTGLAANSQNGAGFQMSITYNT